jgi:hypothetical protein
MSNVAKVYTKVRMWQIDREEGTMVLRATETSNRIFRIRYSLIERNSIWFDKPDRAIPGWVSFNLETWKLENECLYECARAAIAHVEGKTP